MGSADDRDRFGAELAATPSSVVLDALVRRAADRSRRWLLARQHPDGCWSGRFTQQPALEADFILLQASLGRLDSQVARRCGAHLLHQQRDHGGWSLDPAGPLHLSATVKAYFALKLLGESVNRAPLSRAREAIRRGGGIHEVDSLTRFWLALLGQLPYASCDALPVEWFFGPAWLPTHVTCWGARARQVLVPLSIVWAHRPVRVVPAEAGLVDLLDDARLTAARRDAQHDTVVDPALGLPSNGRRRSRTWLAATCDRAIKLAERLRMSWWRGLALRRATEWILDRCVGSDGLGANFHGIAWSWLALQCQGFNDSSPEWRFCQQQMDSLLVEGEHDCQVQLATSPVRDTAFALQALAAAGVSPDEPRIQAATRWLLTKEVTRRGDWARRSSAEPSGWFREFQNEFYPDVESTVATLAALGHQFGHAQVESEPSRLAAYNGDGDGIEFSEPIARRLGVAESPGAAALAVLTYGRFAGVAEARKFSNSWRHLSAAFDRGRNWLLALQSRDGGWGNFDRDGDLPLLGASSYADSLAVVDPSDARVTGQVLQLLGRYDQSCGDKIVDRAVTFLERRQRPDGSWVDASDASPVETTAAVLAGLQAVEFPESAVLLRAGLRWLLDRQDSGGGWGEESVIISATNGERAATRSIVATPHHTACVILGLLGFLGRNHPAMRRAVAWLIQQQHVDGRWDASSSDSTRGSIDASSQCELQPNYLPLLALGHWAKSP